MASVSSSLAHPQRKTTTHSSTAVIIATILLLLNVATYTSALAFQLPKIRLPWDNTSSPPQPSASTSSTSALQPNDTVLLVGGTGGVAQLVTKKLRSRPNMNYGVRVTARDVSRATETIDDEEVTVFPLNLVSNDDDENGTTEENLKTALTGVKSVVISLGTTAFPTKTWSGGNTPKAVDELAVTRVANAAAESESVERVVLLTSVGVDRTKEMPFLILNLFGVLDAKKAGEQAVIDASKNGENFDYAIVRPGRLVGGPFTNIDLVQMMQIEGGAENGLTVESGDQGLGDCKRDACAEAVVQCLERVECQNLDFSIVSNEEKALTDEQWATTFAGLSGED